MCNLITAAIIILQKQEDKHVSKEFKQLIWVAGIFTVLGVFTLKNLPDRQLIIGLSLVFIILTIVSLFKIEQTQQQLPGYLYKVAGAVVGFLAGCISVSGPPLALFLNRVGVSNNRFREIFSWLNLITASVALVGFIYFDMISMFTIKQTLIFSPILYLGTYVGKRVNSSIPVKSFKTFTLGITLAASVILLVNEL